MTLFKLCFAIKHKHYRVLRKNGCKNYELLGLVFSKSTATGHLHHASTQLPPNSDEERINEEEFLNRGVRVAERERFEMGNSSRKRPADDFFIGPISAKKDPRIGKIDLCVEKWFSTLDAKLEKDLAKAAIYKSEIYQARSEDPYSIEACMGVLEIVENITDGAYNKALEKFISPEWRKMFILMSSKRRWIWLESL